jgi:hypothetical protein
VAKVIILVHLHLLQLPKIFMGKFLIGNKKTYDFLLVKKNFNFPIGYWVEIIFCIGHPIVKGSFGLKDFYRNFGAIFQ